MPATQTEIAALGDIGPLPTPMLSAQPMNVTVLEGQPVSLSTIASGIGELTYQWRKDETDIPGATRSRYSLAAAAISDGGSYTVLVTATVPANSITKQKSSSTRSMAARVLVNPIAVTPVITNQPVSATVTETRDISFNVAAVGNGILDYQWRRNGAIISGATATTYTLTGVTSAAAGTYTVVVRNSLNGTVGTTTSDAATLTVQPAATAPVIATQPQSTTATATLNVTLRVAATGNGTLTYQWRKDGVNLIGATDANLLLTNLTANSAGTYLVVVTNSLNGTTANTTSGNATLTIAPAATAPVIATQPANRTVTAFAAASFSVVATGNGTLTYQWRKDGASLAGATAATLLIDSVSAANAGVYSCVVTNSLNGTTASTTSGNAVLIVNEIVLTPAPDPLCQRGSRTCDAPLITGDIAAVRVTADGWFAEVDVVGFVPGGRADYGLVKDTDQNTIDNDATRAKFVFTVTSQGYSPTGVLGTIKRTVYGTKTVRKPYPFNIINNTANDTTIKDEVRSGNLLTLKVALSDFIYKDDRNGGAGTSGVDVTLAVLPGWYTDNGGGGTGTGSQSVANLPVANGSTLTYPKVIGRWAWVPYERVTGDFLVEAVAVHRFGQSGKPLAGITFTATDAGGRTSSANATNMTQSTRTGDPNPVLVYAATLDIDPLAAGNVIDVNFRAYPWVGDESSVLDSRLTADGTAQPHEKLGPFHVLNDKNGTYGSGYALVSTQGNDATGVVFPTQAAAEAGAAFRTIGAAATAIKTFHNLNHARNDAGGGTILLAASNVPYDYPGTMPAVDLGTAMATWLTIKPASTAARAGTRIGSGSLNTLKGLRVKLEGLTLSLGVGNITGRQATDALWLHGNAIAETLGRPYFAWKTAYATRNQVTSLPSGFNAGQGEIRGPFALVRGNNSVSPISCHFYAVFGNNGVSGRAFLDGPDPSSGIAASSNTLFAFNTLYGMTTTIPIADRSDVTGVAIIQNLYERIGPDPQGLMEVSSGNGAGGPTTNFLFWHNTFVGERHQWGYNSEGILSVPKMNWGSKFNYFTDQGNKTDTFEGTGGGDGRRVGNWPLIYSVGNVGNKSMKATFPIDFDGLFSQWANNQQKYVPGFTNDKSKETGTGEGGGTYTLLPTSPAIDVANTTQTAEYQLLPFDLLGNPRYGSPDTGAFEYQPPFRMGVNLLPLSVPVRVYADEKWRPRATPPAPGTARLAVALPGADTSVWLDVTIATWNAGEKTWTERSGMGSLAGTEHVVGDLVNGAGYEVRVNNQLGARIVGAECTQGVCRANGAGQIVFTYTGTYGATAPVFNVTPQ